MSVVSDQLNRMLPSFWSSSLKKFEKAYGYGYIYFNIEWSIPINYFNITPKLIVIKNEQNEYEIDTILRLIKENINPKQTEDLKCFEQIKNGQRWFPLMIDKYEMNTKECIKSLLHLLEKRLNLPYDVINIIVDYFLILSDI